MEDRIYFWTMFFVFTLCFTNLDGAIFPIALEGLENLYGAETHDNGPIIARKQEEPVQYAEEQVNNKEETVTEKAEEEDYTPIQYRRNGMLEGQLKNEEETVTEKAEEEEDYTPIQYRRNEMAAQYVGPDGKDGEHLPPTKSDMGAQYVGPDGKDGEHLPSTKSDMGAQYVAPDGKDGTHLPESVLTRSTRCSTGREITVGPKFMLTSSEENNKSDRGNGDKKSDGDSEIDKDKAGDEENNEDELRHTTTRRTGRPYRRPGTTKIPGHYIDDN